MPEVRDVPRDELVKLYNELEEAHGIVDRQCLTLKEGRTDTEVLRDPLLCFLLGKAALGRDWLVTLRAFIESHGVVLTPPEIIE